MKKFYGKPAMLVVTIQGANMLADSVTKVNGEGSGDAGIKYGGSDQNVQNPSARVRQHEQWNEW